jgi:hypothetical protein
LVWSRGGGSQIWRSGCGGSSIRRASGGDPVEPRRARGGDTPEADVQAATALPRRASDGFAPLGLSGDDTL